MLRGYSPVRSVAAARPHCQRPPARPCWLRGMGLPDMGRKLRMSDQKIPRGRDRRGHDRTDPRQRRPLRHGLRRRHLQHRGLSGARRRRRGLCHGARRRSLFRRHRLDGHGRGHQDRPDAARARPAARPLHDRDRQQGRAPLPLLARRGAGARAVRAAGLESHRREHDGRAADLLLRHHAVALLQHRARPPARHHRDGAPAGRQGRVRRQLPAARLEGRSAAHPHRVHGGAQARRRGAADLRRRGGAVGRSEPGGDGRAAAGVRRRRDRGEERAEQRAGRGRRTAGVHPAARRSSSRSTPRRRATASTPATSRRGCRARTRRRPPPPGTGSPARRCATAAPSCRATRPRCIRPAASAASPSPSRRSRTTSDPRRPRAGRRRSGGPRRPVRRASAAAPRCSRAAPHG